MCLSLLILTDLQLAAAVFQKLLFRCPKINQDKKICHLCFVKFNDKQYIMGFPKIMCMAINPGYIHPELNTPKPAHS